MLSPTIAVAAGASASMKKPGRIPARRQSPASANIDVKEKGSVSCGLAAAQLRGEHKKVMPKAFTKQAAAKAAESASSAPTAGTRNFRLHDGSSGLNRIAWKVSHSETKPFSGGSAEMATQPTRKVKAVSGMP